jgi:NAD-dependent deacetylase
MCTGSRCGRQIGSEYVNNYPEVVPLCPDCGSLVKPDVILFGENIKNYFGAREMILKARLLIVIGSSLTVYPLAGFVKEFSTFTQDLIIINKGVTGMDHAALVKLEVEDRSSGDILEDILSRI